jgi:hypothetical protein
LLKKTKSLVTKIEGREFTYYYINKAEVNGHSKVDKEFERGRQGKGIFIKAVVDTILAKAIYFQK